MAMSVADSLAQLTANNNEMLAAQTAINKEQMRASTQKAALDANRTLWEKIR